LYRISVTGTSSSDHNREVAALNSDHYRQAGFYLGFWTSGGGGRGYCRHSPEACVPRQFWVLWEWFWSIL